MILGASASALAAGNVDVGKAEYEAACAACHGRTGKGDGPLKPGKRRTSTESVIPAKTGIHVFKNFLDPRLRGDDLISGSLTDQASVVIRQGSLIREAIRY